MVRYTQISVIFLGFVLQAGSVHLQEFRKPTVISQFLNRPTPKVFFFAGVEGSGVRLFQTLWTSSWSDRATKEERHTLQFPPQWGCGVNWTYDGLNEMVERFRKVKQDELWALPFQATYPSCGIRSHDHANRVRNYHPHLDWIKQAADEAGVELRVIFLHRKLKDCLTLTCQRRFNEDCGNQSLTLHANAIILRDQLKDLGKGVVSCFEYPNERHMMLEMNRLFNRRPPLPVLKTMFRERFGDDVQRLLDPKWIGNIMEQTQDFNNYCRDKPRFSLEDFKTFVDKAHENPTWKALVSNQSNIKKSTSLNVSAHEKHIEKRPFANSTNVDKSTSQKSAPRASNSTGIEGTGNDNSGAIGESIEQSQKEELRETPEIPP